MPRAGRRDREVFTGWIAGLGTDSGHRVVVGHWPRSPFGVVTDAMVQDPAGHRTLYAPTAQLAEFLAAAYRFDEVRVAHCGARRSGPGWTLVAGGCCQGSGPGAGPATDVASGMAPGICIPSSPSTPPSTVMISAACKRSTRRSASALARCRAGHPWFTSPPSSRLSPLDRAATGPDARGAGRAGDWGFAGAVVTDGQLGRPRW